MTVPRYQSSGAHDTVSPVYGSVSGIIGMQLSIFSRFSPEKIHTKCRTKLFNRAGDQPSSSSSASRDARLALSYGGLLRGGTSRAVVSCRKRMLEGGTSQVLPSGKRHTPKALRIFARKNLEPLMGIEPMTPPLPWECSTSELQRLGANGGASSSVPTEQFSCRLALRSAGSELQRLGANGGASSSVPTEQFSCRLALRSAGSELQRLT